MHDGALGCATHLVRRYLSGDYTGGLFDPHGYEPDNRITRSDLLAVRSLSMVRFGRKEFLRKTGAVLDDDDAASASCTTRECTIHVGCLLRQLPVTSTIFTMTSAQLALANGPLWNLLESLFKRTDGEAGAASLSKTLARKRPALLPIIDGVALRRIQRAGGPGPKKGRNWEFLRNEILASSLVVPGVAAVRADARVPDHYQDLRIIDIVVWMRQHVPGRLSIDVDSCQPL